MKLRSVMPAFALLFLAGSLAYAAPTPQSLPPTASAEEIAAAIFLPEPESGDCAANQTLEEAVFVDIGNPHCGSCGHPNCSGASFGAKCGVRFGQDMFCVQTYLCSGEGLGHYRCTCEVNGAINP